MRSHRNSRLQFGRVRYSAVEFLIAIIVLFVTSPFVHEMPHGPLIEACLFSIVLVSAVLAIGIRGRKLLLSGSLCSLALLARWTHHFLPDLIPAVIAHFASLLFLGFVVYQMLAFVLRAPEVTGEVLCAAITAYLLIGMVWTLNYVLLAQLSPGAFAFSAGSGETMTPFNAFYFSFVVLSTVGFGDITPVSPTAKMLAVAEAITGMFYVTILVSRLVAMYRPAAERNSSRELINHE